jgi:hypothetical protein
VQIDDRSGVRATQDVRDLRRCRRRAQALRLDRPEHAALLMAAQHAEERRVHHAPRRAEQRRRSARQLAERHSRATDLRLRSRGAAEPQAAMRPAVPGHLVAGGGDGAHGAGRTCGALADQEERRAHPARAEGIEHARRELRVRAVVERERDAAAGATRGAPHAQRREQVRRPRVTDPREGAAARQKPEGGSDHRCRVTRRSVSSAMTRAASGRR